MGGMDEAAMQDVKSIYVNSVFPNVENEGKKERKKRKNDEKEKIRNIYREAWNWKQMEGRRCFCYGKRGKSRKPSVRSAKFSSLSHLHHISVVRFLILDFTFKRPISCALCLHFLAILRSTFAIVGCAYNKINETVSSDWGFSSSSGIKWLNINAPYTQKSACDGDGAEGRRWWGVGNKFLLGIFHSKSQFPAVVCVCVMCVCFRIWIFRAPLECQNNRFNFFRFHFSCIRSHLGLCASDTCTEQCRRHIFARRMALECERELWRMLNTTNGVTYPFRRINLRM